MRALRGLVACAFVACASCSRSEAPESTVAPTTSTSSSHAAAAAPVERAETDAYAFELRADGRCKSGAPCTLVAQVRAKGPFHVNQEFPHKLHFDDVAGATWLGKDTAGASTFGKAAGDFSLEGDKTGSIRARLLPSKAGTLPVTGTIRFSVCNADNCMVEQLAVRTTVPVQ